MEANNTYPQFDGMITNTKEAQVNLRVKVKAKKEKRADQYGSTITIDELDAYTLGDVSLILNFPFELLEVEDVTLMAIAGRLIEQQMVMNSEQACIRKFICN